jgi:predicted nucleotidyltransferase
MPLNETLPQDIDERLATVSAAIEAASADVLFAYVFGSIDTPRRTPRSDVDLAIYVAESADLHAVRLSVAAAAAKHLRTDAVDVVLLNDAPLSVAGRVLTTRRVILDRQPFLRHRYESITARMFSDFRIREHRLLAERFARG